MSDQPRGTWPSILSVYAVFVLLRFLQALFLTEPVVIPDELVYKSMAYGFFKWQDFFSLSAEAVGAPTNVGYVLYQLPLSLIFFFRDNFLVAGKLLNALMINAAAFPLYALLKEFVPKREAASGAALALLLPSFGYASFLMAENLYLPLFLSVVYFAFRSFQTGRLSYAAATAAFLLLLFLTKPHALSLLVAIVVCGVILAAAAKPDKVAGAMAPRILRSLAVMGAMLLIVWVVARLVIGGNISRVADFVVAVSRGIPAAVVSVLHSGEVAVSEFLTMVSTHLGVLLFLFLTPLIITAWGFRDALRTRKNNVLVFTGFILFLVFELLALSWFISLFLAPEESFSRLHGRFAAMVFPLLVISFVALRKYVAWTPFRKTVFLAASAAALLAVLPGLNMYFRSPLKFTLAVDYPELAWAAFVPAFWVFAMILLFLITAVLAVTKRNAGYYLVFFVVFALGANIAESWIFSRYYQPPRAATQPARTFIADTIRDPNSRVAVFDNGEIFRTQTVFWLPYRFMRAATLPERTRLDLSDIPEDTDFVILFGTFRVDFTPIRGYRSGNCRVLRLSEHENVTRDFRGVHLDSPGWAWTENKFAYFPREPFQRLIITLNDWKPYLPEKLTVRTDLGEETILLDKARKSITLPYSRFYLFTVNRTFNPRELGINREDDRDLGINLRSAVIEFIE